MTKKQPSIKQHAYTTLAALPSTLGYIFSGLLWTWAVVLYVPLLQRHDVKDYVITQPPQTPLIAPIEFEPSLGLTIFAITVTALVIVGTLIVLFLLPKKIYKSGEWLSQKTTQHAVTPLYTRHHKKKLSSQKKRQLGYVGRVAVYIAITCLPLLAALVSYLAKPPLSYSLVTGISLTLFLPAALFFSIDLLIKRPPNSRQK